MSPLALCSAAALLFTAASVEAVYGPEMAFTAADFPQIAVVVYKAAGNNNMPAFIISASYLLTHANLIAGQEAYTEAYSGDLSNAANAAIHSVVNITRPVNNRFSIVKLCPPISRHQSISLIQSENFNYQTNTTGKVFYWKPNENAMFYRTTDVLTDAACTADNAAAPNITNYIAPRQTCAQYDPANDSCKQRSYVGRASKNFPILLINAKTAAIGSGTMTCTADGAGSYKTTAIAIFHKAFYLKSFILPLATVDFA